MTVEKFFEYAMALDKVRLMQNINQKKSQKRLVIAIVLFAASIISSFLISYISQTGDTYWVTNKALPKGVQINAQDVALRKITFGEGIAGYLPNGQNPIGSITKRSILSNQLIHSSDLTDDSRALDSESLSLSIAPSDIPNSVSPGDLVTLYQVFESRSGEVVSPPERIISGIFIKEISRTDSSFSGKLSMTISLARDLVPIVLAATSNGRIVVVSSNG